MIIRILGAESLGVRGLACLIELQQRKIFIDPGIALGWHRYGFLPHPFQIAIGSEIRKQIIHELQNVDDVIISHFDGDHCPLLNANPYQLNLAEVKDSLKNCRILAPGIEHSSEVQKRRRDDIAEATGSEVINVEGREVEFGQFSHPVPHGPPGRVDNLVMMSRISENGETFVHASDIQLIDFRTIETILNWKPDTVLVSGPPLYHYTQSTHLSLRDNALQNARKLTDNVAELIIDHHLLRSEEGIRWLESLKKGANNRIFSAAEYMRREPIYLEAWRDELYQWLPLREDEYNGKYIKEKTDFYDYRIQGWDVLIKQGKIKPCKYYYSCPIRSYTESGRLERYWMENYCLVANQNCIRYKLEEKGEYHPNNMLPDGQIKMGL